MLIKQLNIIMLDDHSLFMNGLKHILAKPFKVNFRTFNSIKSIEHADLNYNNYDLMISDLDLPNEDIFYFFEKIKQNFTIPILVISMHQKISLIRKCDKFEVNGYILKNDDEFLLNAVCSILAGENYYSPSIKKIINSFSAQKKLLSDREEQVIKYICDGYSNQKIANFLNISIETVKTHKKNIKVKLGVSDTAELIDYAKKNIIL